MNQIKFHGRRTPLYGLFLQNLTFLVVGQVQAQTRAQAQISFVGSLHFWIRGKVTDKGMERALRMQKHIQWISQADGTIVVSGYVKYRRTSLCFYRCALQLRWVHLLKIWYQLAEIICVVSDSVAYLS